jgi:hypothetical protein
MQLQEQLILEEEVEVEDFAEYLVSQPTSALEDQEVQESLLLEHQDQQINSKSRNKYSNNVTRSGRRL